MLNIFSPSPRVIRLLLVNLLLIFLVVVAACSSGREARQNPFGTWRGKIKTNAGEEVAFTLEVAGAGSPANGESSFVPVVGTLVNGDDRLASTSGTFDGQTLKLRYDFYDGELQARLNSDHLQGTFVRQWQKKTLTRELHAQRATGADKTSADSGGKDISGEWLLRVGEGEQQRLWRAAFKQQNGQATGTIMPLSGDWGQLAGTFENNTLTLNRFDVINCRLFKATLLPDGRLDGFIDLGLFDPKRHVIGERINEKNKALVASLPDPLNYTRMANASEPFRFSFPDLNGQLVSWNDARFKNKAVIVSITGSWCPNCHEETPFLQELYARYKEQGLEVVALAFEYTGQAARDLEQVKIFARRYGVQYPMLLAGSTEDAPQKLAQLVNFGAYPTTIFIGRDGLVKRIHAGFEGKATSERFTKLKAEMEELVKELLGSTS